LAYVAYRRKLRRVTGGTLRGDLKPPDILAGTSFIHALAGRSEYTKESFYLEWRQNSLLVLNQPSAKVWNNTDIGHRVRAALLGRPQSSARNYVFSVLRVGKRRILIASEVHARDKSTGEIIEVAAYSKGGERKIFDMKNGGSMAAIELAVKGSARVAHCLVKEKTEELLGIDYFETKRIVSQVHSNFEKRGIRVVATLEKVLAHPLVKQSRGTPGRVLQLLFGDRSIEIVEANSVISVVPK